ncbi:hypothetical protein ATANTOWER_029081, partial [Ataeniobius toweri]|nr:hypothetical protein [Ataeniobius toweri]
VFAEDCSDPCLLDLQNLLPKYYGTWSSPESPNDLYLKLEDVTNHFNRPCIMDVKLGQRSYDPFASQEKREQQIRKYPLMEEIGFLILGMRAEEDSKFTVSEFLQRQLKLPSDEITSLSIVFTDLEVRGPITTDLGQL